jgi:hypothetical protein
MALNYPDRRIKPIVYLMSSLGIQLGAFDYLKWGDIEPIMKNDNFIAAKVRVYAQDEEEYYSFTTKEAYESRNFLGIKLYSPAFRHH